MESGPAAFAGAAFALFGAGLLTWTGVCALTGQQVADGVSRPVAAVTAVLAGVVFLATGGWLLAAL
ncbi:hypothetical protein ACWD6P_30235 [Streptomyces sp. NPDC002446]